MVIGSLSRTHVRELPGLCARGLRIALANQPTHVFDDPLIRRAKLSVVKRGGFRQRAPMFLRLDVVRDMLALLVSEPHWLLTVMCCLTAYIFLLRVPSECLPISTGAGSVDDGSLQSVVCVNPDSVELRLRCRKNNPQGSRLLRSAFLLHFLWCVVCSHLSRRTCWCSTCPIACPVHVLGSYFSALPLGSTPFASISPGQDLRISGRCWAGCQSQMLCFIVT